MIHNLFYVAIKTLQFSYADLFYSCSIINLENHKNKIFVIAFKLDILNLKLVFKCIDSLEFYKQSKNESKNNKSLNCNMSIYYF